MLSFKEYVDWQEKCRADRRGHRKSGIYGWFLNDDCLYIGQTHEFYSRFATHAEELAKVRQKDLPSKQKYILLRPYADLLEWRELEVTDNLDEAENKNIEFYRPIFNVNTPYGKQYFTGEQKDIDDYVSGKITMDDLRALVKIEQTKK